ncbi:MAG: phage replication initiation protein [Clostridium perfringens]|nr:replisome organizer [Clostridium perfringens]MDU2657009.1 phage replication initiation protein [Clostridium perfringens]
MAERRMFSKTIIDSDIFLDMPLSTQALYFHLSMRADDDGFVNNPRKIERMVGCGVDDRKILIAKQFIIPFESGICVIKHWRIHNYIRNDRYKPTMYQEEKEQLLIEENKAYSINKEMDTNCLPSGIPNGRQTVHHKVKNDNENKNGKSEKQVIPIGEEVGIPSDNQVVYQRDTQNRLGQDRLGQDRTTTVEIEEVLKSFNTEEIKSISKFCSKNNVSIDVVVEKFNIIKNLKKINNRVGALITAIKEDWKPNRGQVNNNCNFSQRDYDYDSLEKQLLGWEE